MKLASSIGPIAVIVLMAKETLVCAEEFICAPFPGGCTAGPASFGAWRRAKLGWSDVVEISHLEKRGCRQEFLLEHRRRAANTTTGTSPARAC